GMRELVISLDCCRVARRAGILCRRLAYTERPTVEGHLRESHVGSLNRRRDEDREISAEKKPSEALEHLTSQAPPSKKFGQGPAEKVTGGQSEGGTRRNATGSRIGPHPYNTPQPVNAGNDDSGQDEPARIPLDERVPASKQKKCEWRRGDGCVDA